MGNDLKPGPVGQNLLRIMGERGLKVNELARMAKLSRPSTLTEILKGRTQDPKIGTVHQLAAALGVDPDDLTLTKAELVESERVLAAFTGSEEARRLGPPLSAVDVDRLRARRARIVRGRLPDRGIRMLVRELRSVAHEQDYTE